jgi:hypothetical protein
MIGDPAVGEGGTSDLEPRRYRDATEPERVGAGAACASGTGEFAQLSRALAEGAQRARLSA